MTGLASPCLLRNQARSAQNHGKTQLCPTSHPVRGGHGWGFIIHPNRASLTRSNRILILLLVRLSMRYHVVWSKRMLTHSEGQRNPNQKEKRRSKNNEVGSCGRPHTPFNFHVAVSFKGSILNILEVFTVFPSEEWFSYQFIYKKCMAISIFFVWYKRTFTKRVTVEP